MGVREAAGGCGSSPHPGSAITATPPLRPLALTQRARSQAARLSLQPGEFSHPLLTPPHACLGLQNAQEREPGGGS